MHRPGRHRGRRAHGAAHLLAYGLGVDDRAPLHHRLINRLLVDALAQSGLKHRARVGIGDRDQRRAIEEGVRHAVDHVGRAGTARGKADAGTAGEIAPGRGQHRAGDFLLHQQKPHLALPRGFHQFHRFAARVPDDERGAGFLERGSKHFDGRGHWQSLPDNFFCCGHHGRTVSGFPTARSSHANSDIAVIHYYIDAPRGAQYSLTAAPSTAWTACWSCQIEVLVLPKRTRLSSRRMREAALRLGRHDSTSRYDRDRNR